MIDKFTVAAAIADAHLAAVEFDDALAWLRDHQPLAVPLAAEVWVTDPARTHVLLVRHRWRGWVPPGGTVDPGETPRAAAARELAEETGVTADLLPVPAAVAVRSFRADWAPTLSLSYGAVVSRDVPLSGEAGQPPKWFDLNDTWESSFPEDRDRIRAHVRMTQDQQPVHRKMTSDHGPRGVTVAGMEQELDDLARTHDFSGVVRVDDGREVFEKAWGMAHRGYKIPNTVDTRFAIASGCKAFTALAVVSLIEQGTLSLDTKAREILEDDLPLIDDEVTVGQLLAHRSGIGDYFDEENITDINDYILPVPVQNLRDIEQYVAILDGFPQKFPPGTEFAYNNGGYVVLSLIAERASGVPYHDLVRQQVCEPAGLADTEFLRSDSLGERTAIGYLPIDGEWRTNVFHLPIRGGGDGGIYTTAADVNAFWKAFFAGRIVSEKWVAEMVKPHSEIPEDKLRYGLGFWLHGSTSQVQLVGWDAGVSFKTTHDPETGTTRTVIGNTSDGVWPLARFLNG